MSLSCAAQQLTKENATHRAKGKIANNTKQCSCFYLLSLPKEKYLHIVYEVVCLCYISGRQCFEEMRFFKEVQFSLQSIRFDQKVVVIYKLVVAFELVKCIQMCFSGRFVLWRFDCLNNNMCSLRCVLCSKVRYSCLPFIMVTLLQADADFFKVLLNSLV